ncbi:hypothetical protein EI94DRAFT_1735055 [Lactarius quietus]|nr:hypothetical protein EI94DRAFT_1735055 [Lactarius quietus]
MEKKVFSMPHTTHLTGQEAFWRMAKHPREQIQQPSSPQPPHRHPAHHSPVPCPSQKTGRTARPDALRGAWQPSQAAAATRPPPRNNIGATQADRTRTRKATVLYLAARIKVDQMTKYLCKTSAPRRPSSAHPPTLSVSHRPTALRHDYSFTVRKNNRTDAALYDAPRTSRLQPVNTPPQQPWSHSLM